MTFRISTCEFPDSADLAAEMWQRLAAEFDNRPVDLPCPPGAGRRRQLLEQSNFR